MKEKSEISNILDYNKYKYLINNLDIKKSQDTIYKEILLSRKFITVVFNDETSSSIQIDTNTSLGKILCLAQKYPQEIVFFEINKDESLSLSKSHDTRNVSRKKLNISEEMELNTKSNFEYSSKKIIFNKNKLTTSEKFFFYYMKLLYIFYILCGIILFSYCIVLLLISTIKFKSYFIWVTFVLILEMISLGTIGFAKLNGIDKIKNEDDKFDNDDLFWFNLIVLIFTMGSFILLIKEHCLDIKEEKYVGIIIITFYIIILLVEIIGLLFFDLTDRIVDFKIDDGYRLLESNEENERLIEI